MPLNNDLVYFKDACREAGLSWYADWMSKHKDCELEVESLISGFNAEYIRRFSIDNTFTDLIKRLSSHQRKAVLQAFVSTHSPFMIVMAYRIVMGARIKSVSLNYESEDHCQLKVTLSDKAAPDYQSNDIHDATVLRHFGVLTMDNKPIFDGFYALNLQAH